MRLPLQMGEYNLAISWIRCFVQFPYVRQKNDFSAV